MKVFTIKKGTTHYYDDSGKHKVVSVLGILDTVVAKVEKRSSGSLVHFALIGKKNKTTKPVKGQYPKTPSLSRIVTETVEDSSLEEGAQITIADFAVGDKVSLTASAKGKGFAGTIKRYGFKRGPKTHGSRNYRKPGSIGDTGPQRVVKGKKMAGRMGMGKKTIHNVEILKAFKDKSEIWVSGHVPGPRNSITVINKK